MAPRRRLGQHFLHDSGVLHSIVSALEIDSRDRILEIGPGEGVLTRALASRAASVTAIELDDTLAANLRVEFSDRNDVTIIHGDALQVDPCRLMLDDGGHSAAYKLSGNIPYYITGALLRRYLEIACPPGVAVLMVQWEVAQRMLAKPGEMNMLALSTQLYSEPSIVAQVRPSAFRPRPKVDSAVVKLEMLKSPRVRIPDAEAFFAVARAGFSTRRKQLVNGLSHGLDLSKPVIFDLLQKAEVGPTQRPEELSLDDWSRIALMLQSAGPQ